MSTYTVAEGRTNFCAIIEMVEHGERVKITKRGKVVATVIPEAATPVVKPKLDLEALRVLRESMPYMKTNSVEIIRRMRDGEIDE